MSFSPSLPSISSLHGADDKTIESVLDLLFEPSADLHALTIAAIRDGPPFTSYSTLIEYVGTLMSRLTQSPKPPNAQAMLHGILGSHPRLGEKKVDSAQSRAEQAHLNTSGASQEKEEEAAKLKMLNDEYETRYPGLRYVVFVNGRSRIVVMQNMRERIDRGDIQLEEKEAIQVG